MSETCGCSLSGSTMLLDTAFASWALVVAVFSLASAHGTEGNIVFQKELGEDLRVVAQYHAVKYDPKTLEEGSGQTGHETCSFKLLRRGVAESRRNLLDVHIKYIGGAPAVPLVPTLFPYEEFKVYDVARAGNEFLMLMHEHGEMALFVVTVDANLESLGWEAIRLFGSFGRKVSPGVLPIESAQVIPAGDRIYAFFVSKSGKCMLWQVQGEKPKKPLFERGREGKLIWENEVQPKALRTEEQKQPPEKGTLGGGGN